MKSILSKIIKISEIIVFTLKSVLIFLGFIKRPPLIIEIRPRELKSNFVPEYTEKDLAKDLYYLLGSNAYEKLRPSVIHRLVDYLAEIRGFTDKKVIHEEFKKYVENPFRDIPDGYPVLPDDLLETYATKYLAFYSKTTKLTFYEWLYEQIGTTSYYRVKTYRSMVKGRR